MTADQWSCANDDVLRGVTWDAAKTMDYGAYLQLPPLLSAQNHCRMSTTN